MCRFAGYTMHFNIIVIHYLQEMRGWFVLVGVAVLVSAPGAFAQIPELQTVTVSTTIQDTESPSTHNMVLTCTDAVLIYGLNLFIPYNDEEDSYSINADSIRLGAQTVEHDSYSSANEHVNISLLEGSGGPDLKYPLLLPKYTPLVIPIHVLDSAQGNGVGAILDVTYASDGNVQCEQKGLYGTQKIGFMTGIPLGNTDSRTESMLIAIEDYNRYLADLGEHWQLEMVLEYDEPYWGSALSNAEKFHREGIRSIIGPSASSSVADLYDFTKSNDMVVLSCCSTAPSLAMPDHIFRLTPDDTNQARALAAVLTLDGINTVVIIHRDDTYGHGLSDALAKEMEQRGGMVASAIPYSADETSFDTASLLNDISVKIGDLVDEHGPDNVAVVAISFTEITKIAEVLSDYPVLSQVRWYGSEAVVNLKPMVEGELGTFSTAVKLSGVQQSVAPNPQNTRLVDELQMRLDLPHDEPISVFTYTVYDSLLVLANTMLATQSSDADDLIQALPHVAMRTSGTLNNNSLNENGDLASADYSIWQVIDNHWTHTGTYVQSLDVVEYP